MAVKLRLRRMGSRKRPFYRLVAADSRFQRDGRFLEVVGYYDPMTKPHKFEYDKGKIFTWLKNGAQMSDTVEGLLRQEGLVQEYNLAKIAAKSSKNTGAETKAVKAAPAESESEEKIQAAYDKIFPLMNLTTRTV